MSAPAQSSWIEDGQQVGAVDLDSFAQSASVMAGEAVTSIIGASDANTDMTPLTAVPGPGMSVVIGGPGQTVLVQSRLADYIPAQTLAIAAASGSTRLDLIAFQYADVIVPTGANANFMDVSGNIAPAPTAYVYRGINLTVVTGTPGGGRPGAPGGFDPLAQVTVPPGTVSISAGNILLLLPTIKSLLIGLVGGGVTGVNGKTGAIAIDPGNAGITVDNTGTDIKINNAGVISLNGQTGAQSIINDTSNVTITNHGTSVGIGVSTPAAAGVNTITSTDGSIGITVAGQNVNLGVTGAVKGNVFANALTSGNTTGTISLGMLPGTASQNYVIRTMAVTTFHDMSSALTLTGSGATWPTSPAGAGNGQGGNTPCAMAGTAKGGQNPTVDWSQNNPIGGTPLYIEIFAFPL